MQLYNSNFVKAQKTEGKQCMPIFERAESFEKIFFSKFFSLLYTKRVLKRADQERRNDSQATDSLSETKQKNI